VDLDLARHQWQDGIRRVEATRADRARYAARMAQVDILVNALRQRVGQVFTLDELAQSYEGADDWARAVLDDADPEAPPVSEAGTVADAAFHVYARGATDYRP
jgi:hypothetical protein